MRLPSNGREYAKFAVSASTPLDADLAVSFDGGTVWHELDRPDASTVRVLVAGPDAADNPLEAVLLADGHNHVLIRLRAIPEDVVRPAGVVYVYTPDN